MGMKNKQKRAGVKREGRRGLHGLVNLREDKLARTKAQSTNSRAAKVAASRGLEAPAPLQTLSKSAARRQKSFARQERGAPARAEEEHGADPGATLAANIGRQRAFHKELERVVAMSDVLLEVLDARDPLGCRCAALETAALEHRTPKRIVIVLNKADLVPPDNLDAWVRYLRRFHPTLAFKATDLGARRRAPAPAQPQLSPAAVLGELPAVLLPGSQPGRRPLGAVHSVDDLIQLLKSYSRSDKLLTAITVGVVGYPNVGKSSVINALKRAKAVTTGAMPGVTRSLQVVALDRKIKLVDCPGVVFAKPRNSAEAADMVLRSALKLDAELDATVLAEALLRKCEPELVRAHFGVGPFDSPSDLLALVALKRGLLRKGGMADMALAARVLVQEWTSGAIAYHSLPPRADETVDEGAAIVGQLAPAFDVERIERPAVEVAGVRADRRKRERAAEAAEAAGGEGGEGEGGEGSGEESEEPSELAGTMEDDLAQSSLLAALHAGSRRRAPRPADELSDPNLIRKAPLARSKVRRAAGARAARAPRCGRPAADGPARACAPAASFAIGRVPAHVRGAAHAKAGAQEAPQGRGAPARAQPARARARRRAAARRHRRR